MKRTYQPSKKLEPEDTDSDLGMATKNGRKLIARRRAKGRKRISA